MDVLRFGDGYRENADDPDKSEYFVPVKWLETRAESEAVNEVGFFGNQNTVCKPTTPKWRHTVDKLKRSFPAGTPSGLSKNICKSYWRKV